MPLSKEMLNELFEYRDGEIYYKVSRSRNKAGEKAGTLCNKKYYRVKIDGKVYLNHRIIFMMHYGYLPKEIDHIDGNKLNNKIENLRPASHAENQWNTKKRKDSNANVKGVSWHKKNKMWNVKINCNNNRYNIGYFKDLELAELVAIEARNKYHGEFANHGAR